MKFRLCPLALCTLLAFAISAPAQFLSTGLGEDSSAVAAPGGAETELVTASLVADTTAVQAGKDFTVGVHLKLKPGWHTYWLFAGESGLPPKITWELPEGFKAGPIQWPIPKSRMEADFLTYVYEDDVVLPVQITAPATLPAGKVTLSAKVSWLACDKQCIPGKSNASIDLPTDGTPQPANAELFAAVRAKLPKENPPFKVTWDRSQKDQFSVRVEGIAADQKVEFFPLPPDGANPGHPKVGEPAADGSRTITVPIPDGDTPNLPWKGLIVTEKGGVREGWSVSSTAPAANANAVAPAAPTAPATTTTQTNNGAATPSNPTNTPPATSNAVTPAVPSAVTAAERSSPEVSRGSETPAKTAEVPDLSKIQVQKQSRSLIFILATAFLGGLILNIMPCVLPVIALKIFSFVKQAGEHPKRVFHLGLAFVAGVFVFFLTMAGIVVALHGKFTWGTQFQNPYLFSGLIAIIFVFGLNLLGVFEITLSSGATTTLSELSGKEGYFGAFLHGLFTTLLGTSCTAPFLVTSLAYATTQPPVVIFAIFTTIAAGMSLPYFLLTAKPAWMRFLPKPGMWMVRAKEFTGFIMLAVAVWLLGVFAGSHPESLSPLLRYLLLLGVACWLLGVIRNRFAALATAVALAALGYFVFLGDGFNPAGGVPASIRNASPEAQSTGSAKSGDGIAWTNFSEDELRKGLQSNQPVFIDFTADWCINCKTYERLVLETPAIRSAFREHKIVALRADWTDRDPVVSKWLEKFGGIGVPLYVLFRPGEKEPVVMDALTQGSLLTQLGKIKADKVDESAVSLNATH